jgi:hypothetical protein
MEEEIKQRHIKELRTLIEKGYSKESIIQTGNLKGLTDSDVTEDLLDKLKGLGISLEKPKIISIGNEKYKICYTSSKSCYAVIPKNFVKDFQVKAIKWQLDIERGCLIGIPTKR